MSIFILSYVLYTFELLLQLKTGRSLILKRDYYAVPTGMRKNELAVPAGMRDNELCCACRNEEE